MLWFLKQFASNGGFSRQSVLMPLPMGACPNIFLSAKGSTRAAEAAGRGATMGEENSMKSRVSPCTGQTAFDFTWANTQFRSQDTTRYFLHAMVLIPRIFSVPRGNKWKVSISDRCNYSVCYGILDCINNFTSVAALRLHINIHLVTLHGQIQESAAIKNNLWLNVEENLNNRGNSFYLRKDTASNEI